MNLYTVFSMILVFSVKIPDIHCYGNGEIPATACTNMIPSHGSSPQTSPSPYEIKLSTTSYTSGSQVEVTLETNCVTNKFRGFLIQARRADNAATDRTTPIGSFTPVADTKQWCGTASNMGLIHSTPVDRTSLKLVWTAPTSIQGHIVFKVTFVESPRTRFWVGVTSEAVLDDSGATLDLAPDSTPTTIGCSTEVENKFAADTRCGTTIGCYSDCDSSGQCTYLATWVLDSPVINFTIKVIPDSENNVYAAIGFSTDVKMGDDSVIECLKTTSTENIFTSYNTGRSNARNVNQIGITLISVRYENKILECVFTREITRSGDVKLVDLNTPHYMLFAQGPAASTDISRHSTTPTVSPQAIDFKQTENFSAVSRNKSKVLAHGALMVIAWITAASIGLVAARYFKPIWPNSTLIGQKIWFQIHRTCMILTLLATCIAFIIIFVEVDGWTMSDVSIEQAHPYLGVIVTILTIVNPIMALFRPHPNTDNRYIFNWAHWGVGTVAYILGIITVAIGTRMSKANLDDNAVWIVVGFTVWQLIVVLCLELVHLVGNKQKTDSYELQGGQPEKNPDTPAKPENGTLKQAILIIHIVVVLAFTIALIVYIGMAE